MRRHGGKQHSRRRRGRKQRSLERIEESLAASDPRLASMFAIFTTMTQYEPMPVTERVATRPRRLFSRASFMLSVYWLTPPIPAP
jgi:hypothetical protein